MKRILTILYTAIIIFGLVGIANAITYFNDGLTHNITTEYNDVISIDHSTPNMYTTLNFLDGSSMVDLNNISDNELQNYEDGIINVNGGALIGVSLYDRSRLNMIQGSANMIMTRDNSQVNVSGGTINNLKTYENSQVDVSGGYITQQLYLVNDSIINVYGGNIVNCPTFVDHNSVLTFYGSDFVLDNVDIDYGELISIDGGQAGSEEFRVLSGILESGDSFTSYFKIGNDAKIVLASVPIPTSIWLLGSGLIGMVAIRKRK